MAEPTQEQIKQAQEAGNEAYRLYDDEAHAYNAYRIAYDETLAVLTAAADEAGVTAEWTPAPDTAQMIRIVKDALNDPAIEY
jgi:hypothetical protein